ncbi:MAG: helix-turn-helix domain-containing protein, partial [Pyrinomonadaceae bacterium]|nr:helix-turn-helix domain-containing protein [Pyrinomonadaceae bacterium]
MDQDRIFRAMGDPSRRRLLDLLFIRDGQSLQELTKSLPMTRFGVMKHLKILEEAGLIVHRKVGRSKFHYLNPVPIQEVYDRWVSKYAKPFTGNLMKIKRKLESSKMSKHKHVYEILIETTPAELWRAITNGDMTRQYYFGTEVVSDWKIGSELRYIDPDKNEMLVGEVLEIEEPKRLVTTFDPRWEGAVRSDMPSKVSYEIDQRGNVCCLTLTHDELDKYSPMNEAVQSGWTEILSGLKT